jgi:DNA-binding NarL/FixJ family response regulator
MADKAIRSRMVIADDHSSMVSQISVFLPEEFIVVAIAHDGASALDCIQRLDPDIVLVDLYMPGMNGLDVVKALRSFSARTAAVVMSGYDDSELAKAALAAGAVAFVTKTRLAQDLLPALRAAVQGSVFVSS